MPEGGSTKRRPVKSPSFRATEPYKPEDPLAPPEDLLAHANPSHSDLAPTPRWKKIFQGFWFALRLFGIVSASPLAAEEAPQAPGISLTIDHPQTALDLQTTAQNVLDPIRAPLLVETVALVVPGENTPEKKAEATGILQKAYDELRSTSGEIAKDVLKGGLQGLGASVLLAISGWLTKSGMLHHSGLIEWLGGVVKKIGKRLGERGEEGSVTAEEIAADCKCTVEQATAVLTYLGFRRRGDQWIAGVRA
jgi:hypothetical protein